MFPILTKNLHHRLAWPGLADIWLVCFLTEEKSTGQQAVLLSAQSLTANYTEHSTRLTTVCLENYQIFIKCTKH